jgi:hypothetical protein
MRLDERWLNFVRPYINKLMNMAQRSSDISYEEWKELKQQYKETIGKDYERTN